MFICCVSSPDVFCCFMNSCFVEFCYIVVWIALTCITCVVVWIVFIRTTHLKTPALRFEAFSLDFIEKVSGVATIQSRLQSLQLLSEIVKLWCHASSSSSRRILSDIQLHFTTMSIPEKTWRKWREAQKPPPPAPPPRAHPAPGQASTVGPWFLYHYSCHDDP